MSRKPSKKFINLFRNRLREYEKRSDQVAKYLKKNPHDWGKYQDEFNLTINNIFTEIMQFIANNDASKVQKLQALFIKRYRDLFLKGSYNLHSLKKPYGYAGDFEIIDAIYDNSPATLGYERLFDNYFQMSAISVAVRNRKEDFKRLIIDLIKSRPNKEIKVMSLACGPCREVKELFENKLVQNSKVQVYCFDHDQRALDYAKTVLKGVGTRVHLAQGNAIKMSLSKNIEKMIPHKFDLIYSTGLFDYFDHKVTVKLLGNLRKLLNPGGVLAVSDMRDKHQNPSVYYMEWVGEWCLVYNNDDEFRSAFREAGFSDKELEFRYEQQGILQYAIASIKGSR